MRKQQKIEDLVGSLPKRMNKSQILLFQKWVNGVGRATALLLFGKRVVLFAFFVSFLVWQVCISERTLTWGTLFLKLWCQFSKSDCCCHCHSTRQLWEQRLTNFSFSNAWSLRLVVFFFKPFFSNKNWILSHGLSR